MKKVLLAMSLILFVAVATQAQTSGLCTGTKENAAAGKDVEKMTGGYNPDKMDRVKSDGIPESICAGSKKSGGEHESHGHEGGAGAGHKSAAEHDETPDHDHH